MATSKNLTPAAAPAEPQAGGRYVRNADGSITRNQQTEDGRRRAQRSNQPAAATPAAPVDTSSKE